jgi:cysteine desulfurase
VNGDLTDRLPGSLNVMFPNASATAMMYAMPDLCCSAGSACSAADIAASYVLRAMGISEQAARHSLRLSVGRFTSAQDITDAVAIMADAYRRIEAGSEILNRV